MLSSDAKETAMQEAMRRDRGGRVACGAVVAALVLVTPAAARAGEEAVATAEVASDPATVWALLTDFERWEQVFPAIASLDVAPRDAHSVRLRTATRTAGLTVRYTLAATLHAGERRLECTLDRDEPSDVRALDSSWRVEPAPGGGSRVELRVRSEAGLSVPSFVERRMTRKHARESVEALVTALAGYRVVASAR